MAIPPIALLLLAYALAGDKGPAFPVFKGKGQKAEDQPPGAGHTPKGATPLSPLPGAGWHLYEPMPPPVAEKAAALLSKTAAGKVVGPMPDPYNGAPGREVAFRKEPHGASPTGQAMAAYYRDTIAVDVPPPPPFSRTEKTDSDKGGTLANAPPDDEYPTGERITDYVDRQEESSSPKAPRHGHKPPT